MQKGPKRTTRCTPREAWLQLEHDDRRWITARLSEDGKRYIRRRPALRATEVDHEELLRDAVQHGQSYMLRWDRVQEWTREDLFRIARKSMIWFIQKQRDKLLRRMGAPDPDQDLVIEPRHEGEPEADILRTHEVERIGRPFAEPDRLPIELLEAIKIFYQEFTGINKKNRADVCTWLDQCWNDPDALTVTEAGNIEQEATYLAQTLGWSEVSLQKTRERVRKRRESLRKWLEERGYGQLLRDVLGPH